MKKKVSISTAVVIAVFAVILTFQITSIMIEKEYQDKVDLLAQNASDFSKLAEADALIRAHFFAQLKEAGIEEKIIRAYVDALEDPNAQYLDPEEYAAHLTSTTDSGYGIGARFTYDHEEQNAVVYGLFENSPAMTAGLQAGDVIVTVDGQNVSEIGFYEAVSMMSSDHSPTVTLGVRRLLAAQWLDMEFTIQKAIVKVDHVTDRLLNGNVAYLALHSITSEAVSEFQVSLDRLVSQGAKGVLLDLRNTEADDFAAAISLLDLLLPEGEVARLKNRDDVTESFYATAGGLSIPVSVLINESTSGTAELIAAVLRDCHSSKIIGTKSVGNPYTRILLIMVDGSAIILSDREMLSPVSASFAGVGITPDVESKPNVENPYLIPLEKDQQVLDALQTLPGPEESENTEE